MAMRARFFFKYVKMSKRLNMSTINLWLLLNFWQDWLFSIGSWWVLVLFGRFCLGTTGYYRLLQAATGYRLFTKHCRGVYRTSTWSLLGIYWLITWCLLGIFWAFTGCYWVFMGHLRGIYWLFMGRLLAVSRGFTGCLQVTSDYGTCKKV